MLNLKYTTLAEKHAAIEHDIEEECNELLKKHDINKTLSQILLPSKYNDFIFAFNRLEDKQAFTTMVAHNISLLIKQVNYISFQKVYASIADVMHHDELTPIQIRWGRLHRGDAYIRIFIHRKIR
jgi:hypothetical protein